MKKFEMGFIRVTRSKFAEIFTAQTVALSSGHMLSKQEQQIGFWEGWAGSFNLLTNDTLHFSPFDMLVNIHKMQLNFYQVEAPSMKR